MATQYATIGDLHSLVIADTGNLSDDELNAFLSAASSEANMYLRSRYRLPLVSWGMDLTLLVSKLAATLVIVRRGSDVNDPTMVGYFKGRDEATKVLLDVANSRAALDVVDTSPAASTSARVYSRPLRGW